MLDIAEGNLTPIVKSPSKSKSLSTSNDEILQYKNLPDIFLGDKIFLQKGMENMDTLIRYIVSYGGEVVDEHEFGEATLIVRASNVDKRKPLVNKFGVLSKKKSPEVTEKLLLDSISQQTRQSISNYKIL